MCRQQYDCPIDGTDFVWRSDRQEQSPKGLFREALERNGEGRTVTLADYGKA